MEDAAQGELRKHEVFAKPFKVKPMFEYLPTPGRYRSYPGGKDLPSKTKIWRVQTGGAGGVVSRAWGFEDSPDAELLAPGFNHGKESGAVGIGRHANFLQWGFSAPPSEMTEAGRALFLNCVVYISAFDGVTPLVRKERRHRTGVEHNALSLAKVESGAITFDDPAGFLKRFPKYVLKEFKDNWRAVPDFYRTHRELIYVDSKGVNHVDRELAALGIPSNRQTESLQLLINLLETETTATQAQSLLRRYTQESYATAAEWQSWFDENQDRIYFSDVGGYKFRVTPKGYRTRQNHANQ
jgi:hypothetical protein